MGFVYTELPPDQQAGMSRHLEGCPDCRAQVDRWRATLTALDTWQIGSRRTPKRVLPLTFKWALAAAVVLGFGLTLGRLTSPEPDLDKLRVELVAPLRAELRSEFHTRLQAALSDADQHAARQVDELDRAWAATRQDDRQFNLALYNRMRTQVQTNLAWFRRDLETVAVLADQRLDTTERTLGQLASATPGH